ncbi:MAG TPA: hypothetical protein VJZ71_08555 [Phycisphaerae bacterium]|nr:hypothetical protein [Phycisphaerae bacterium]
MTTISNPVELRRRGLEVLVRELGFVNAMRFMLQYESGVGDYTRERQKMIPHLGIDKLIEEANRLVPPEK